MRSACFSRFVAVSKTENVLVVGPLYYVNTINSTRVDLLPLGPKRDTSNTQSIAFSTIDTL